MRLTHIRLAGFKSFVEPTSFAVPSNLVGVVGPNGCGKSNIIDAVRWVLGESKASELRGESMQDVIFNGSTNRKAASRASVELVFDNAEGRAGGSWNQYSEISVKRVLTRDGASTYYINQQAVRRRDVQDIFLGTGLGPRAYAIIGQGMIARIIEARPEELRIFLEEAAGVSKYKERRRETGNRLADTRDNLTRIEDILRELTSQIERLEQQATVARQFKELEEAKNTKQRLLWYIRYSEALEQKNTGQAKLERAKADLEAIQAKSISTQTELFAVRERQVDAQQQLENDQTQWIEANRQVSRLEADLRVMAESRARLGARVAELELEIQNWTARQEDANARLEEISGSTEELQAELEERIIALEEAELAVEPVEQALQVARSAVDQQRAGVMQIQQALSQVSSQQESASRAENTIQVKLDRLESEKQQIAAPSVHEMDEVQARVQSLEGELSQATNNLGELENKLAAGGAELDHVQAAFNAERDKYANAQAQLQALEKLNDQLAESAELMPWVESSGLGETPRLLGKLQVERGWERALESALRESLDSFQVRTLDLVEGFAKQPPPARVAFMESSPTSNSNLPVGPEDLASLVRSSDSSVQQSLVQLLAGYLLAPDLPSALLKRKTLKPGQRVFTPQGHCVSVTGVSFYAADNAQSGRLERQQQIEALRTEVRALDMLKNESMAKRDQLQLRTGEMKANVVQARNLVESLTKRQHEAQVQLIRLQEQQSRADSRREQIGLDLALLQSELEEQRAILLESEDKYAELDEQLAVASDALESRKDKVTEAEQALRDKQAQVQNTLRRKQDAEFNIRNQESRQRECERDTAFASSQIQQIQQRKQLALAELEGLSEIEGQEALQGALEERVIAEEKVAVSRDALEQIMAKVSELERSEKESDKQADPLRDAVQDLALKIQAAELTIEQYKNLMDEVHADVNELSQQFVAMEVPPKASVLQAEVTRLTNGMQELGAVNLAALDELAAATERKSFLDQQAGDLIEAMETLEDAISKIDKETRDLLSETFGVVNGHFSRLFPKLFGGGEARLVMTGDEILDAGVQVFAQPPGKKNGTIHLLSGGEKALTATALVFAIFELNPAPFCLLDEVDAPLDDANTERFTRLVKQMSEQTQFLFISHNKIAMEMAQQLIGVTMQEKGVSRIVAVDLAAAEKMATETV
ncbi:Chromosome partition protein Smc [Limnobacter sp. 130]|uniref:chromosome segregation protein SMC n=1 Tax=Limnobacter sp. 130 TaxID=2653147 RepID=UPI0012F349F1|nr:chromosome segregation protein SMC [Limnobacter sp. 130]VWX35805.1 Chromosome partition protein Smc [Limnobacter sp. 130]